MLKPRLLYLITRTELAGAQVHVRELAHGFRERFDITIASGEDDYLLHEAREMGLAVKVLDHLVQPINPLTDLRGYLEIKSYLKKSRFDLVHCHSSKAGLLGRLACARLNIPCVFTAHGWGFTQGVSAMRGMLMLGLERMAGRLPAHIIAVSNFDRDLCIAKSVTPPAKVTTVLNGISEISDASSTTRESSQPVKLVMVARFAAQKNQLDLLRASRLVHEPHEIVFIGEGRELEACRNYAKQNNLQDRVCFLGSREDTVRLLPSFHIFALISNWEGLPISILEAIRAGLPVIATNVGGVSEAVDHGVNGFLHERGDVSNLATQIQKLILDASQRQKMGLNSRKLYLEKFTANRMLENTFRVYKNALGDKSQGD